MEIGEPEVVIGMFAPLVTAIVKQSGWSRGVTTLVGIIVVAVAGLAAYALGTEVNVLAAWMMAIVTYYGAWKPTGVASVIEEKTYLNDQTVD